METLIPQEWTKTRDPRKLCPNNAMIWSANRGWLQHQVDGCSVYFVSNDVDDYGFYSVIYCHLNDDLYRRLLALENSRLRPGEAKHIDLNPNTMFGFDIGFLNGNVPRFDID